MHLLGSPDLDIWLLKFNCCYVRLTYWVWSSCGYPSSTIFWPCNLDPPTVRDLDRWYFIIQHYHQVQRRYDHWLWHISYLVLWVLVTLIVWPAIYDLCTYQLWPICNVRPVYQFVLDKTIHMAFYSQFIANFLPEHYATLWPWSFTIQVYVQRYHQWHDNLFISYGIL